ncbi:hypothetical protein I4U23_023699 [Adineta vaga]|nr:hypothetical protein I4U23_023699 [Adineta vaga]
MKQQQLRTNQKKSKRKNILNVQLDIKCSCSMKTNNAIIQFARRYLQCKTIMPIRTIRLFIESIIPYSSMIKISIFDADDRLLKDSDRLCSLKHTTNVSNYIPLYFTVINSITSLTNCSCLSPSIEFNSSSTIISSDKIDQILSTYSVRQSISTNRPSSFHIFKFLPTKFDIELDEASINQITSEFGEICPSLCNLERCASMQDCSLDVPLDLSMKSHALTSPIKWIET